MLNKDDLINVLSYHTGTVGLKTKDREYIFEPYDGITPTIIPLTLSEIIAANSYCNHFKNGLLTFEDDQKKEIYKELRILDVELIKTDKEIEDMIVNPTMEKLQWIIDVKDGQLFERVRGLAVALENEGANITVKVKDLINRRYKEIKRGQLRNTSIVLRPKDTVIPVDPKVADLESQLAEMKAMMEQMIAGQQNQTKQEIGEDVKDEIVVDKPVSEAEPIVEMVPDEAEVKHTASKKAGRPPNKNK